MNVKPLVLAVALLALASIAAPARGASVAIGARIPGAPQDPALIDAYAQAIGRAPAIISYYREWNETVFDTKSLQAITSRHAVPLITWEPTVAGWQRGDHSTILATIVDGGADRYLRTTADAAARWPGPVFLRFAPEMNGGWSPWGVRVPGNSAALYVAAWRHVVTVFRSAGARNVRWVWCPNVDDFGALPFTQIYPGNRWVDWVGMDGYNFGDGNWESFTTIFASSYDALSRLTSKPMMIAETGSAENGGSKAAWITSAFDHEIPRFTRLRALVWFNGSEGSDQDFRYNSSPSAANAFRSGLSSPRYAADATSLFASASRRRAFVSIPSPPAPKHGLARALDLARRHWPLLAVAAVLLALFATLTLRSRRRRRQYS